MSLEDKAKEYARVNYDVENDRRIAEIDFKIGYRQALKDMIDRAEELQLPHIRMYKIIAEELSK